MPQHPKKMPTADYAFQKKCALGKGQAGQTKELTKTHGGYVLKKKQEAAAEKPASSARSQSSSTRRRKLSVATDMEVILKAEGPDSTKKEELTFPDLNAAKVKV